MAGRILSPNALHTCPAVTVTPPSPRRHSRTNGETTRLTTGGCDGKENSWRGNTEASRHVGLFACGDRPRDTFRSRVERRSACRGAWRDDDADLHGAGTVRVQDSERDDRFRPPECARRRQLGVDLAWGAEQTCVDRLLLSRSTPGRSRDEGARQELLWSVLD